MKPAGGACAAAAMLLLAATLCTLVPACLAAIPPGPIRLCMIAGPPELSPQGSTEVVAEVPMSLAEASLQLRGLSMDMVDAVFSQILQWPIELVYKTGFSKTLYQTRVGDG